MPRVGLVKKPFGVGQNTDAARYGKDSGSGWLLHFNHQGRGVGRHTLCTSPTFVHLFAYIKGWPAVPRWVGVALARANIIADSCILVRSRSPAFAGSSEACREIVCMSVRTPSNLSEAALSTAPPMTFGARRISSCPERKK